MADVRESVPKGNPVAQQAWEYLEKKCHAMEREAIMAICNNRDFQFGTVLALQMQLKAAIDLQSRVLGEAYGVEAVVRREQGGPAKV